MRRLPLRLRLTLAFGVGMTVVLLALALVLHVRFEADLTNGIDMELRSRAQVILAAIAHRDPSAVLAEGRLIDPDEAFAQVLSDSGRIVDTSAGVAGGPIVPVAEIGWTGVPTSFTTRVARVDDPVRLLAVPTRRAGTPLFVVVGSTLGDRNEALARLNLLLAVFGSGALAVVCAGGWLLAGAALRPVERMRREASAISESELDRRLRLPPADDELSRLGSTLNALLARLQEAFRREGRFLDQASHELRTPLAVLKMELDLASEATDPIELREALLGAAAEADRLVRLAEDLLVLARVRGGRLPVRRVPVDLRDLVGSVCDAHSARASAAGSSISWSAPPGAVLLDPSRVRQAVEDLLDNAVQHGAGGPIAVSATHTGGGVWITVRDHGAGFPPAMLSRTIEPFAHGPGEQNGQGAGLGLTIVRAVAEAHGGSVTLENPSSGGAVVTVILRVPPDHEPPLNGRPGHGASPGEPRGGAVTTPSPVP